MCVLCVCVRVCVCVCDALSHVFLSCVGVMICWCVGDRMNGYEGMRVCVGV